MKIRFKPTLRDMDALGHVNNAVYSTWLENAREAWWRKIAGPFDLFPFLLARTEIDFRSAVSWRDDVRVDVWVSRVGTSSFELTYAIDAGRRVADAKTVLVMYDHAARKTVPIGLALRRKLNPRTAKAAPSAAGRPSSKARGRARAPRAGTRA